MLTTAEWVISIILIIVALVIIVMVLFQRGDDDGLSGTIAGSSSSSYDSYLGKNEGRTTNAKLAKFTRNIAIVFFVLILLADIITLAS